MFLNDRNTVTELLSLTVYLFTIIITVSGLLIFTVSGLFFIIPCIDSYTKVDLRTVSFDVPPQEVSFGSKLLFNTVWLQVLVKHKFRN